MHNLMTKKEAYSTPECVAISLAAGSLIAQSGLPAPDFGDGGDLDLLFNAGGGFQL